jgi:ABC-type microcin C transport system permease subunit YejE
MGERVEKFRNIRKQKRKYKFAIAVFLILLFAGLCVVDYSLNYLIKNEHKIEFVTVKSVDTYSYEISFFNRKFYVSTYNIKKDLENIISKINILQSVKASK